MTETQEQIGTRERIIEAAGELFAANGFRATTVRDICGQAGVNVAAVNYHFRDKETLYGDVLRHLHRHSLDQYPIDLGQSADASPEEKLAGFVRSFLHRLLDEGRPAWHGKLMAMEMADPTPALDGLVAECILPIFTVLNGIVRELLGPGATDQSVAHACGSVLGQILHYKHARPVIERMGLWQADTDAQIAALAAHIVAFSLGGMDRLRREQAGAAPNTKEQGSHE